MVSSLPHLDPAWIAVALMAALVISYVGYRQAVKLGAHQHAAFMFACGAYAPVALGLVEVTARLVGG